MTAPAALEAPSLPRRGLDDFTGSTLVFCAALLLYALLSGGHRTPYDSHVHLAFAWLHGQITPATLPAYLEHLQTPRGAIMAYGPGPALLLLPLVALRGMAANQSMACYFLGAVNVLLAWRLFPKLVDSRLLAGLLTLLFAVGTPHLFNATQSGNTWPFMHVVTIFAWLIAFHDAFGARRGWIAGLACGLVYVTRLPAAAGIPFLALILLAERPLPWRRALKFAAGLGVLVALTMVYNWLRLGNPLDGGYATVNLAITDPQYMPYGNFSSHYVVPNLRHYFTSLPDRIATFPYWRPSQFYMSFLLITPALLMMPFARGKWLTIASCWGAIVSMMALYMAYYWPGCTQFGMRYTLDWLPFGLVLIAMASRGRWRLAVLAGLTLLGVIVEVWGLGMWRLNGWA